MTTDEAQAALSYEDRIDKRFDRKTTAVSSRIRSLLGDTTQTALADRIGKSDSTVSNHLSGTVNLTLRTIAEYEVALGGRVVTVPESDGPDERRRRRRSSGTRRVSEERKTVREIDPAKRRYHRLLTHVSVRIGQLLDADEECTQQELANRLDKDPSYVSRVLGGGVNLTLRTIVQFEKVIDACVLDVKNAPRGTFSGQHKAKAYVPSFRESNDGCYLRDQQGKVTKGLTGHLNSKSEDAVADEPVMAA